MLERRLLDCVLPITGDEVPPPPIMFVLNLTSSISLEGALGLPLLLERRPLHGLLASIFFRPFFSPDSSDADPLDGSVDGLERRFKVTPNTMIEPCGVVRGQSQDSGGLPFKGEAT